MMLAMTYSNANLFQGETLTNRSYNFYRIFPKMQPVEIEAKSRKYFFPRPDKIVNAN